MKMILTLFPRFELRARLAQIKGQILRFAPSNRRLINIADRDRDRPQYRANPFVFKRRPNPP
jgi:hypothetical protein